MRLALFLALPLLAFASIADRDHATHHAIAKLGINTVNLINRHIVLAQNNSRQALDLNSTPRLDAFRIDIHPRNSAGLDPAQQITEIARYCHAKQNTHLPVVHIRIPALSDENLISGLASALPPARAKCGFYIFWDDDAGTTLPLLTAHPSLVASDLVISQTLSSPLTLPALVTFLETTPALERLEFAVGVYGANTTFLDTAATAINAVATLTALSVKFSGAPCPASAVTQFLRRLDGRIAVGVLEIVRPQLTQAEVGLHIPVDTLKLAVARADRDAALLVTRVNARRTEISVDAMPACDELLEFVDAMPAGVAKLVFVRGIAFGECGVQRVAAALRAKRVQEAVLRAWETEEMPEPPLVLDIPARNDFADAFSAFDAEIPGLYAVVRALIMSLFK